jgi:hypothetical protein
LPENPDERRRGLGPRRHGHSPTLLCARRNLPTWAMAETGFPHHGCVVKHLPCSRRPRARTASLSASACAVWLRLIACHAILPRANTSPRRPNLRTMHGDDSTGFAIPFASPCFVYAPGQIRKMSTLTRASSPSPRSNSAPSAGIWFRDHTSAATASLDAGAAASTWRSPKVDSGTQAISFARSNRTGRASPGSRQLVEFSTRQYDRVASRPTGSQIK